MISFLILTSIISLITLLSFHLSFIHFLPSFPNFFLHSLLFFLKLLIFFRVRWSSCTDSREWRNFADFR